MRTGIVTTIQRRIVARIEQLVKLGATVPDLHAGEPTESYLNRLVILVQEHGAFDPCHYCDSEDHEHGWCLEQGR